MVSLFPSSFHGLTGEWGSSLGLGWHQHLADPLPFSSLSSRDAVSAPPSPGMTHEDIVQESKKYWQQVEAHAGKASSSLVRPRAGRGGEVSPHEGHPPSLYLDIIYLPGNCRRV